MTICATCGNDYDKTFQVILGNKESFHFDSFECAIQMVAIACAHCGCKILGHGVESQRAIYCCANCAKRGGERGLTDRVD